MLAILFLFLAGIFDAVSDSVENEHIHDTIFSVLPFKFWSKRDSWKEVKRVFSYPMDAWHISKSLWIICIALAISLYSSLTDLWYIDFIIFGFTWNASFNLFYTHIFQSTNKFSKLFVSLLYKITPKYLK